MAAPRDFDLVLERACQVWEPSVARVWLHSQNAHLGGARPIDVLRERGAQEVLDALDAAAAGTYA